MSISLMSEIFKIEFKKPLIKFVFIALADCANSEGECYPSIPTISKKCSVSVRFVFSSIKELQNMGYLNKQNRTHDNGRNRSNIYQITLPILHSVHGHTAQCAPSILHTVHPSKENHNIESSKESNIMAIFDVQQKFENIFDNEINDPKQSLIKPKMVKPDINHKNMTRNQELFWSQYPKKQKKERALKIFDRINPEINLVLEDIAWRKLNDPTWKDYQFIPNPDTYLNNKRWLDEKVLPNANPQGNNKRGGFGSYLQSVKNIEKEVNCERTFRRSI